MRMGDTIITSATKSILKNFRRKKQLFSFFEVFVVLLDKCSTASDHDRLVKSNDCTTFLLKDNTNSQKEGSQEEGGKYVNSTGTHE